MKPALLRLVGPLVAALLALPACQRPEEAPRPPDLLPKEQLTSVLADIHTLEAQVEQSRLPTDSARALFRRQQKELFWKRAITDSTFRHSYRYYGSHGKDLDEIYGAVIDTLDARAFKLGAK